MLVDAHHVPFLEHRFIRVAPMPLGKVTCTATEHRAVRALVDPALHLATAIFKLEVRVRVLAAAWREPVSLNA
jgi:hypothetical protein